MKFYSDILASVFASLSGEKTPKVLLLNNDNKINVTSDKPGMQGRFELPASMIPPGADQRCLPGDESFLEQSFSSISESNAKCVFVYPPLLGDRVLSSDWRKRFGQMGIPEVIAESLIGDASAQQQLFAMPVSPVQVLALLVPSYFISSLRSGRWRKEFFPAHSAVVIEHGYSEQHDAQGHPISVPVPFSTVVFQRQTGPIRFFKMNAATVTQDSQQLVSDMKRLLQQSAGKSRYGYVHQGPIVEGYPCSYDFYSEETQKLRQEIGELGERVSLSSVAEVLAGFRPSHPERDEDHAETGFQFINATDITQDGRVDLTEVQTQSRPSHVLHYLKDGDYCIRQIYKGDRFVVGVYEDDGRPISFSRNMIVVRPHATLNPAQRQVLLSFLRSPLAHRLNNVKQLLPSLVDHYRVTPHILNDFPVPLADKELVSAIEQLSEARTAFTQWIMEIDRGANAILMETTPSGSRRRMLQAGLLARQRHRAAQQVEKLDYRIRTQFPHPLAYVWKELQVAGPDRYQRLRVVTKAAEAHTCFLALIAILISRACGQPINYVNEIAKRLSQRKSGTNFGDWFAIIKEVNESRVFRQIKGVVPFVEVTQLNAEKSWEPSIKMLMGLRNDDSHGRIAPANVSQTLLSDAESALESIYHATEFLTDYRLLYITETRFDSIRHVNHIQYRDLSGDNVLALLCQDQSTRFDLESNSLYLRDRQGTLHLFRPLLQYLECPECHQMCTFFLDTYDGSSGDVMVGLKSIERNSVRIEAIAEDYRHIGLLPTVKINSE
jgi:hypothetical protein